eukprot:CAMPEP_0195307882 /NCGR_PEP_ID=MMETSP0707-20130614/37935_1 /TAXON_ID=33640 /ORGANISM="Asterionellopsis glacialis, Strain CCMP134" /LENGTH=741 /DNA_ID=CAMNT_0040372135 /DNA_START=132 /DNA_END=2354 /DNA_ORIENTATION=+
MNRMLGRYPTSRSVPWEGLLVLLLCSLCVIANSTQIGSATEQQKDLDEDSSQRTLIDDELSIIEIIPWKAGTCLKEKPPTDQELRTIQERKSSTINNNKYSVFRPPMSRIIGGDDVLSSSTYPFFVSWGGECGASLIHEDIVLTAAHCAPIQSTTVIVNSYKLRSSATPGATVRSIASRVPHPDYDPSNLNNDFMILKLDEPVESTKVTPLALNDQSDTPRISEALTVIGLGVIDAATNDQPETLQEVEVDAMSSQYCRQQYGSGMNTDVTFCAGKRGGGKDSCRGDSGGPIFNTDNQGNVLSQVGVVSWGIGCAEAGFPGVYARVSSAKQWIDEQICELSKNPPSSCDPSPPLQDELEITVKIVVDLYPTETSWTLFDSNNAIVHSVTKGTYTLRETEYIKTFNLKKNEEYTFEIKDSTGDGICCATGDGYYEISTRAQNNALVVLASGAAFASSERKKFVVSATNAPTPSPPTPAPVNDDIGPASLELLVLTDMFPTEIYWTLTDQTNNQIVSSLPRRSYSIRNQLYTSPIVGLHPGRMYDFTMYDSGGDGICCTWGNGNYKLKHGDRVLINENGEFGSKESTVFQVPLDNSPPETPPPPTNAPVTIDPTKAPVTFQPTNAPVTEEPTKAPSTAQPTNAPITRQPTRAPIAPTNAPITPQPTKAPETPQPTTTPTKAPVTPQPTQEPTRPPTTAQPTNEPTDAPITPQPTEAPIGPRSCSNKEGTVRVDHIFGEQNCEW